MYSFPSLVLTNSGSDARRPIIVTLAMLARAAEVLNERTAGANERRNVRAESMIVSVGGGLLD